MTYIIQESVKIVKYLSITHAGHHLEVISGNWTQVKCIFGTWSSTHWCRPLYAYRSDHHPCGVHGSPTLVPSRDSSRQMACKYFR